MKSIAYPIFTSFALLAGASAATITFPDVEITSLGSDANFTGFSKNLSLGTYFTDDTNMTFQSGDTVSVTIRSLAGTRFMIAGGTTGATLSIGYGNFFITDVPFSSSSVTFNGLSGGAPPSFTLLGQHGVPVFSGADGLHFGSAAAPWSVPDTVTFDSITFTAVTANAIPSTLSSNPIGLEFLIGGSGLSQVPVPEPSSTLCLGLGALSLSMRRRRK